MKNTSNNKRKGMFSRLKKVLNKNKCAYKDIYECPYSSAKECSDQKKNCYHKTVAKKSKKNNDVNIYILVVLAILGIGSVVFGIALQNGLFTEKNYPLMWQPTVSEVFKNLGISLMASCVIALVIDIPSKIRDFKKVIIEAFTSTDYLDELSEPQLKRLRIDITNKLHKKDVPNMPRGLIELDQEICDLLNKPYYKVYREDVRCKFVDKIPSSSKACDETSSDTNKELDNKDLTNKKNKPKFIEKRFRIDFIMHNPYDKTHPVFADLGISKQLLIEKGKTIWDYFTIDEFSISIDKKPSVDIRNSIKVLKEKVSTAEEYYNTRLHLFPKDNRKMTLDSIKANIANARASAKTNAETNTEYKYIEIWLDEMKNEFHEFPNEPKLLVEFTDTIQVKFDYTVYVPILDIHYTKRFRYPVKYYRLDYSCDEDEVEVYGQLISTLLDQSKISTKFSDDQKHLSLESFGWLLPKNGIIAVISRKMEKEVEKEVEKKMEDQIKKE